MTTTDPARHHVEVATQSLVDASKFTPEDRARASFLAEAQVHATLALVEEQRTANLVEVGASVQGWILTEEQQVRLAVRLGLA